MNDLFDKFKRMDIDLTKADKVEIKDDLFSDEESPLVKKLMGEVDSLKLEVKNNKDNQVANQIERTFGALTKKYNGSDGLPKFDADEISDFVKGKNLYMDSIEDTYENAYFLMHKDKIIDAERNRTDEERRKLELKRRGVVEDDPKKVGKFQFAEPLDTSKSWSALSRDILTQMHKQGKSVFVDD